MPNSTIQKNNSSVSQTNSIDIFFIVTGIKYISAVMAEKVPTTMAYAYATRCQNALR
jgi:hypothetical protein